MLSLKKSFISTILLSIVSNLYSQRTSFPNIIFILADDLGYGDLASLNDEGKIPTPNIDRLSAEGTTFLDAHSSAAVSTPSRYGILTGRYNWRSKLKNGVLRIYSNNPLIETHRTTMASMLRCQGYQTACIGKWHLGMNFPTIDAQNPVDEEDRFNLDFTKEIKNGPVDVGFDYFFGVDCPNYPPYCFIENRKTVGIPTKFNPKNHQMDYRAGRGLEDWNLENVLPDITDKAANYIKKVAKSDCPFFLYLPLTSPHTPIVPIKEFKGKTGMNLYTDFVMQTDASVGKILQALKETGEEKNTIVVFAADNGCSPRADFEFLKTKGHDPSYIFRGMKMDLYEGGHHVACMVKWPKHIKPHKVKQTICLTDFMATFASITGYKLADNEAEDSYNILPLLVNENEPKPIRKYTVHHSISGDFAIRQGKWKLLLINYSGGMTAPQNRKIGYPEPYQLYDLENDIEETKNLYSSYPEKVEELRRVLIDYVKKGRSTPGSPQKNDTPNNWKQLYPWFNE